MSTLKKLINSVTILAICAVFTLGLFAPVAMADSNEGISITAPIEGGSLMIHPRVKPIHQTTFRSAVISLKPANETGTIEKIVITGPDGEREFGCTNLKVKTGTDLIQSCGGPAVLKAGDTSFEARGSGFEPFSEGKLTVNLKP